MSNHGLRTSLQHAAEIVLLGENMAHISTKCDLACLYTSQILCLLSLGDVADKSR